MKKVKALLSVLIISIFFFTASCGHDKIMRDYYKTKRQSELAKMSALRSFVRSNEAMRLNNVAMMNKSGSDAGIIALSNAIMSMNQSRAIETALVAWYGQEIEVPKSETAAVISSLGWLAAPISIIAGGWALGYVLNGRDNGGNTTNNNSYNKADSDNQSGGSHRDVRFNNDGAADVSHQPEFSPYSPGSSDSIFGSFSPGSTETIVQ